MLLTASVPYIGGYWLAFSVSVNGIIMLAATLVYLRWCCCLCCMYECLRFQPQIFCLHLFYASL